MILWHQDIVNLGDSATPKAQNIKPKHCNTVVVNAGDTNKGPKTDVVKKVVGDFFHVFQ